MGVRVCVCSRGVRVCVSVRECLLNNYRSGSPNCVVPFLSAICALFRFFLFFFYFIYKQFSFSFFFSIFYASLGVAIIAIHLFRHLMSCQCPDNAHAPHFAFFSFFSSFFISLENFIETSSAELTLGSFGLLVFSFSHCCRIRMS